VELQLGLLRHRGPDADGIFARGPGAVGEARLAVIDLRTGDPPLTSEEGEIGAVLNGEIYNFQALRAQLAARGHSFRSRGDTEVIVHLAQECEPAELCSRLEGMFAFAVWDAGRRRLVLGRDRLGKKPLFYWQGEGELLFASELKALLAHPLVPRRLDEDAIPAYLTFGYVPTPRTFFAGVRSVPPGHVLTFDADTGATRLERYWRPSVVGVDAERERLAPAEAARELRARLEEAVRERLVADVPVGAFLSGGLDSSSVVALMARASDEPVRTFTIGFDDPRYDERPFARQVAERHRTEHVEMVVRPDAAGLAERLLWHYDQPFADASALPTFLLCELTRGHVTVALCGDGGDELFAGYQRLTAARAVAPWDRLPRTARKGAAHVLRLAARGRLGGRLARLQPVAAADDAALAMVLAWVRQVPPALVRDPGSDRALREFGALWRESEGAHVLDRLLDLNLRTYLLDDLLVKMDRASMAHGLEVRSPLLDRRVVELALRLAPSHAARGASTKRVLRAAMAGLVPPAVIRRPKRGFGVPVNRWFRSELRPLAAGTLGAPRARVREHVHGDGLERMLREHEAGVNHGHSLWALLMLELFLRREGW
jgi:asparagine synthase (glutamine-hydrolysing)